MYFLIPKTVVVLSHPYTYFRAPTVLNYPTAPYTTCFPPCKADYPIELPHWAVLEKELSAWRHSCDSPQKLPPLTPPTLFPISSYHVCIAILIRVKDSTRKPESALKRTMQKQRQNEKWTQKRQLLYGYEGATRHPSSLASFRRLVDTLFVQFCINMLGNYNILILFMAQVGHIPLKII